MRKLCWIALASTALVSPAWAQTAVGVGVSRSDSASLATSNSTAIGGGNATANGGRASANARGGTGVGIGTGGNPTASITTNNVVPAVTTQNLVTSGTSTVKNVPSVFAPGLAAAGLETCLGSVSGGGSFVGTGFSFGSTIPDPGCAARLDARTLWSMGLKKAAIARLCLGSEIRESMPDVCGAYGPQPVGYGVNIAGPYYEPGTYRGGPIMLVNGKTGAEQLCQDYDEPRHRCRLWDGETRVVSHKRPKVAAVVPTPAASPLSDPAVKREAEKLEGKPK